ncbi:hypothetical protein CQ016_17145 [Arthrobacter sp. MYb222]|nr:hypothetical protein CQ016_17145 [Arthrobacter sp. MYb222]
MFHESGQAAQVDLWFPKPRTSVGSDQALMLPELMMRLSHLRVFKALMIPSWQCPDLSVGMWS